MWFISHKCFILYAYFNHSKNNNGYRKKGPLENEEEIEGEKAANKRSVVGLARRDIGEAFGA